MTACSSTAVGGKHVQSLDKTRSTSLQDFARAPCARRSPALPAQRRHAAPVDASESKGAEDCARVLGFLGYSAHEHENSFRQHVDVTLETHKQSSRVTFACFLIAVEEHSSQPQVSSVAVLLFRRGRTVTAPTLRRLCGPCANKAYVAEDELTNADCV